MQVGERPYSFLNQSIGDVSNQAEVIEQWNDNVNKLYDQEFLEFQGWLHEFVPKFVAGFSLLFENAPSESHRWTLVNRALDMNDQLQKGYNFMPLHMLAYAGNHQLLEMIDSYLPTGAYQSTILNGNNVLHCTIEGACFFYYLNDYTQCVQYLLNKDKSLATCSNAVNETPMDYVNKLYCLLEGNITQIKAEIAESRKLIVKMALNGKFMPGLSETVKKTLENKINLLEFGLKACREFRRLMIYA